VLDGGLQKLFGTVTLVHLYYCSVTRVISLQNVRSRNRKRCNGPALNRASYQCSA
jgi:hypothetical protein